MDLGDVIGIIVGLIILNSMFGIVDMDNIHFSFSVGDDKPETTPHEELNESEQWDEAYKITKTEDKGYFD